MIGYLLILFLIWAVSLILSLMQGLPDASLPPNLTQFLSMATQALSSFHHILPYTMDALLAILVLLIGIEVALWVYKGIRWIYQKIPGIN